MQEDFLIGEDEGEESLTNILNLILSIHVAFITNRYVIIYI